MAKPKSKKSSLYLWGILAIVVVVAIMVLFYIIQNRPESESVAVAGTETPGAVVLSSLDVPRMSLADAKAAYDSGNAVFIDVRSTDAYETSHIPGALSFPLTQIEDQVKDLDKNALYIDYCT